jgi:hypothetical protein
MTRWRVIHVFSLFLTLLSIIIHCRYVAEERRRLSVRTVWNVASYINLVISLKFAVIYHFVVTLLSFWPYISTVVSAVPSPAYEHYCIVCNLHAETVWFEQVRIGQLLEKLSIFLNYEGSSQDSYFLPFPKPASSIQFVLCRAIPLRSILILSYQLLDYQSLSVMVWLCHD